MDKKKLHRALLEITRMPESAYKKNRRHVARHLFDHPVKGSKFARGMTLAHVVQIAQWCVCRLREKLVLGLLPEHRVLALPGGHIQVRWPSGVRLGTCRVIALQELTPGTTVLKDHRGPRKDAVQVNIVKFWERHAFIVPP